MYHYEGEVNNTVYWIIVAMIPCKTRVIGSLELRHCKWRRVFIICKKNEDPDFSKLWRLSYHEQFCVEQRGTKDRFLSSIEALKMRNT